MTNFGNLPSKSRDMGVITWLPPFAIYLMTPDASFGRQANHHLFSQLPLRRLPFLGHQCIMGYPFAASSFSDRLNLLRWRISDHVIWDPITWLPPVSSPIVLPDRVPLTTEDMSSPCEDVAVWRRCYVARRLLTIQHCFSLTNLLCPMMTVDSPIKSR